MRIIAPISCVLMVAVVTAQAPAPKPTVTPEEYERWKKDLSNWGRWGKDDQIGALNLITAAKRKQAAALVRAATKTAVAEGTAPPRKIVRWRG